MELWVEFCSKVVSMMIYFIFGLVIVFFVFLVSGNLVIVIMVLSYVEEILCFMGYC